MFTAPALVTVVPKSREAAMTEDEIPAEEVPVNAAEPAETAAEAVMTEVSEPAKGSALGLAALGIGIFAAAGTAVILLRKRR